VGCGLATYFWSWPKNTKRKVSRQEEKGGSWKKGREGKGREGKGPAEEAKTRLGPEGHRRKQQSESKEGRIINETVSDARPPVVSMRMEVPKRPRKDGVVGEPAQ
jgi:hypothetical protein